MNVNMIGLGYIGLPTAAVMAKSGLVVTGVDIKQSTCDTINQGKIHIIEPGLEALVLKAVTDGLLKAQTSPSNADVYVIAVPTPFKDNFVPDLSYIKSACESLAGKLQKGNLVILESTSPVGATEKMISWLKEARPDLTFPENEKSEKVDIHVAYCPERVLPGNVIEELEVNHRVIGGATLNCSRKAKAFYENFVKGDCVITNARTAEMAKLTENSFRDVNIAFANELSMISEQFDINVWELIQLANRHPRVDILMPGCGVGGHCIAVDPWFIVDSAPEQSKLIRQAREINDSKPEWVARKVSDTVFEYLTDKPESCLKDLRIACFGLSFKPNIDDLRESPAVEVILELAKTFPRKKIELVEPNLNGELPLKLKGLNVEVVSLQEAESAHIKIPLVGHKEFLESKPLNIKDKYIINVAWAN